MSEIKKHILIFINLILFALGILAIFKVIGFDANAPWTSGIIKLISILTIVFFAWLVIAFIIKKYSFVLFVVTMLVLPLILTAIYFLALFNIFHGTISGPAGFWLVVFNSFIACIGIVEFILIK